MKRFGALPLGDGRTRFAVWAPGVRALMLAIDGGPRVPMSAADGWHECACPAPAGTRYFFELDDGSRLPDPASRFQPDGVHGPSVVVDTGAYAWRHAGWRGRGWPDSVVYELHVGLCGGYRGVRARLSELAALGVTAIELMPLAATSGERNWGYDGVQPYAPHAAFGTPQELQELVDAAHGLGLCVYLDVVYNHVGPEGNHLARYAPPFFSADLQTPWGPGIDFRRPEVRDYFIGNALYWLDEYRFDGLRFDAVHAITDDGFMPELARRLRTALPPQRQVHLILENEDNDADLLRQGFDAQWNDDAHNALHVLLTGERDSYYANFARGPIRHLARCLGEGFAYQGERCPTRDGEARGTPSADLPPSAFVFFLQNHDQIGNRAFGERLKALADADALRAAVALQLLCPQVPLLFMGEEFGADSPFLYFTDFHGELAAAVREGRRRELGHDGVDPQAVPDPNAAETFERSRPRAPADERARWQAFYAGLLRLRREQLAPRLAGARALGAEALGEQALQASWRLGDGAAWTLRVNLGASPVATEPTSARTAYATSAAAADALRRGQLAPRCCVALLRDALSGAAPEDSAR